jgi:hypothetical protein
MQKVGEHRHGLHARGYRTLVGRSELAWMSGIAASVISGGWGVWGFPKPSAFITTIFLWGVFFPN